MALDAILIIYQNVAENLVVYPSIIRKRIMEELPFMATENIMMKAASLGGDRQDLHERIRVHSMNAGMAVKRDGLANDLLERIAADSSFSLDAGALSELLDPSLYIGRCPEQVEQFLSQCVQPVLEQYQSDLGDDNPDLKV